MSEEKPKKSKDESHGLPDLPDPADTAFEQRGETLGEFVKKNPSRMNAHDLIHTRKYEPLGPRVLFPKTAGETDIVLTDGTETAAFSAVRGDIDALHNDPTHKDKKEEELLRAVRDTNLRKTHYLRALSQTPPLSSEQQAEARAGLEELYGEKAQELIANRVAREKEQAKVDDALDHLEIYSGGDWASWARADYAARAARLEGEGVYTEEQNKKLSTSKTYRESEGKREGKPSLVTQGTDKKESPLVLRNPIGGEVGTSVRELDTVLRGLQEGGRHSSAPVAKTLQELEKALAKEKGYSLLEARTHTASHKELTEHLARSLVSIGLRDVGTEQKEVVAGYLAAVMQKKFGGGSRVQPLMRFMKQDFPQIAKDMYAYSEVWSLPLWVYNTPKNWRALKGEENRKALKQFVRYAQELSRSL